jgi:hypothetical protein
MHKISQTIQKYSSKSNEKKRDVAETNYPATDLQVAHIALKENVRQVPSNVANILLLKQENG